jgi:hypothetical protein
MSVANSVTGQPVVTSKPRPRKIWRWLVGIVGGIAVLLAIVYVAMMGMMAAPPADLDLATTRMSAEGLFRATIAPRADPIPINQIHAWTLHVETADGRPVENARISVDGDMPQHKHGMPTRPQVTRHLGNGDYLVEGMKFQMGGWWVVGFDVDTAGQRDHVEFNLVLR